MEIQIFDHQMNTVESVQDWWRSRSFLYGDSHFTTAKVSNGQVQYLDLHIDRLTKASQKLQFNEVNWSKLKSFLMSEAFKKTEGIIKVQISRGEAKRGYGQTSNCNSQIIVSFSDLATTEHRPVSLSILDFQLGIQPYLAGLKHCNRLEQVMIAKELEDKDIIDGLVTDINGKVIETSKANIFFKIGGHWFTPSLQQCGIEGIMRQQVLLKLPEIQLIDIEYEEFINQVEAAVITNSLIGLQVVDKVDGKELNTGLAEQFIYQFREVSE